MLIRLALVYVDIVQVQARPLLQYGICSVQGLVRVIYPEPVVYELCELCERGSLNRPKSIN
jgi:hypothetical protein